MNKEYLEIMIDLAFEGGQIAMDHIHDSQPALKGDNSIVTKADKAISKQTRYSLEKILKSKEHILIDEESPDRNKYLNQSTLNKATYIWSVDPIDGTRLYAHGMPHFGVSIGLMRNLKPWLGVVYFPMLNELFYCDGSKAVFVQNAFIPGTRKTLIKPIDQKLNSQSILLCNEYFAKRKNFVFKGGHILVSACAIVDLCWPAIGRGCGSVFKASIWDMAGSWSIFQKADLHLRSIKTGKKLSKLDISLFNTKQNPWKVQDYYILSSQRNFDIIKQKLGYS